ncbi:MAG: transglutaminase domain-containing protein [Candidatus Korarchaeota archaeon]|nr:transglutaminase domain-containing protein [Thermoproteota archaeon]MCR8463589.1 transglutaminase domain-containing protein [Thermoproteota archaeon]MCR8473716.1 transglutaminase domain-containing protein [Thermoproteota archaeon]MCR8488520.1 transglutaminase domain-containing protein [Thermoproteota archaeon]
MAEICYKYAKLPEDILRLEAMGNFSAAEERIRWLLAKNIDQDLRARLEYELERIRRIPKDFDVPEEEAIKKLREEFGNYAITKFEEWISRGYVDYILINGKRYFFRAFIDNLLFLCDEEICKELKRLREKRARSARETLIKHVEEIVQGNEEGFIKPRKVGVRMTLRVLPNTLEPGEIVRCWLPYPVENEQQGDVKLLGTSHSQYQIAPSQYYQRTIYFEDKAKEDGSAEFWVEYEYTIKAFYRRINPNDVKPFDEESELYQRYTSEQPPHVIFTRRYKQLASEIVGDTENPYLKAEKIYRWVAENMTYTYVAEYSTYENIGEYVAENLRGDCGFHAILFITLMRISGIPARWQSGWYANPALEGPSPHDWAQFYIEPYGWLFADLSFGRYWRTRNKILYEFYFGNIDSFRTVFNLDMMGNFYPPKKYLRSDPVDNQRGEIETEHRNIYYDRITYELKYKQA